jgi:hypothetical protein
MCARASCVTAGPAKEHFGSGDCCRGLWPQHGVYILGKGRTFWSAIVDVHTWQLGAAHAEARRLSTLATPACLGERSDRDLGPGSAKRSSRATSLHLQSLTGASADQRRNQSAWEQIPMRERAHLIVTRRYSDPRSALSKHATDPNE